jgi:hypothetical protein
MKLTTKLLTFTASVLLAVGGQAVAQTPKDQIALQLGAIQMGYTVPFAVSANSTATQKQQAVNSLVMGRNAMNATVARPAATVKGVVTSPNINTADYRDQLYSAVEYVVTSPVSASINGTVVMSNNATVTVNATALRAATVSNDWMTPVPYALESRSSVDTQALRAELVAAGVLAVASDNSTKSFFIVGPSSTTGIVGGSSGEYFRPFRNTAGDLTGIGFRYNGAYESFDTMVTRRIAKTDRIVVKPGNFATVQLSLAEGQREVIPITFTNTVGETNSELMCIFAHPASEPILSFVRAGGSTSASPAVPTGGINSSATGTTNIQQKASLMLINGIPYRVYQIFSPIGGNVTFQTKITS